MAIYMFSIMQKESNSFQQPSPCRAPIDGRVPALITVDRKRATTFQLSQSDSDFIYYIITCNQSTKMDWSEKIIF